MAKTLKEVLEEHKIELRKSGVRWVAKCPFHGGGDRTPPFTIYPNDTYFCFACNAWGDAVKFLVDHEGMSPDAAMDYVGQDYRVPKRKTIIKIRNKGKVWPFLYQVADAYHNNLKKTIGAVKYLQTRGLSLSTIDKYKLGFTDGGVLDLQFAEDIAIAIEYGILTVKGYEIMSHRITIPNIPEPNSCDYIIGRTISHDKIKYLGTKTPKTIYGLHDAWDSPLLFITEGQMDYLVLREWGYPSIVVGGTHITEVNINVLRQKYVVIVPDNDAPGIAAALKLHNKLGARSIVLDYDILAIKDIGEAGPIMEAREEFLKLVKEQIPWQLDTSNQALLTLFPRLRELIHSP